MRASRPLRKLKAGHLHSSRREILTDELQVRHQGQTPILSWCDRLEPIQYKDPVCSQSQKQLQIKEYCQQRGYLCAGARRRGESSIQHSYGQRDLRSIAQRSEVDDKAVRRPQVPRCLFREYVLSADFKLPTIESPKRNLYKKQPTNIHFEIPFFTVSGFQVRYLKIVDRSGYKASPWVKYLTKNGEYQIRMNWLFADIPQ